MAMMDMYPYDEKTARIFRAQARCCLCKRPVEKISVYEEDYGNWIVFRAYCHGRATELRFTRLELEAKRSAIESSGVIELFKDDEARLNDVPNSLPSTSTTTSSKYGKFVGNKAYESVFEMIVLAAEQLPEEDREKWKEDLLRELRTGLESEGAFSSKEKVPKGMTGSMMSMELWAKKILREAEAKTVFLKVAGEALNRPLMDQNDKITFEYKKLSKKKPKKQKAKTKKRRSLDL